MISMAKTRYRYIFVISFLRNLFPGSTLHFATCFELEAALVVFHRYLHCVSYWQSLYSTNVSSSLMNLIYVIALFIPLLPLVFRYRWLWTKLFETFLESGLSRERTKAPREREEAPKEHHQGERKDPTWEWQDRRHPQADGGCCHGSLQEGRGEQLTGRSYFHCYHEQVAKR